MKKIFLSTLIVISSYEFSVAQEGTKLTEKPCYTRQWADSINTANVNRFNTVAPGLVDWYAYEGQTQKMTLPPNVVNIIYIKPESTCPQKTSANPQKK